MSAFDGQVDLLATLIASTATFQSVTGMSTVATAKDKIGLHEALDDDDETAPAIHYPRAVIFQGKIKRGRVGTSTWMGTGTLFLGFEFEAPTDKNTTKAQRAWFVEKISAIMREAEVIADSRATPTGYSTSHLHIRDYESIAGPDYVQPSERDQPSDTANQLRTLWMILFEVSY